MYDYRTSECRLILLNPLPHIYHHMEQTTYGFRTISVDHTTHLRLTNVFNYIDIMQEPVIRLRLYPATPLNGVGARSGCLITITSYRKSTLPKSTKTSHAGMHFHHKTLPQKPTKQATVHIAMHAHTTYTSQNMQCSILPHTCSYHSYIFPATPTTMCTTPPYSTAHQILPSTHTIIHNHLILNLYILHKTQHPTLQPAHTFTCTGTLLPSKCTLFHKSHIHKHKQSRAIPHSSTLPQTRVHKKHKPHEPLYKNCYKTELPVQLG